jgi:hypothetical protein
MSSNNVSDPRAALVRTKYFSLHPKPLERWLWQQGLPQAAERVFWVHWEAGMRNGDWCSEIPVKRVAVECSVDPSTVTRAYQVLKTKGLIQREDPGRDPNNPFCQATAITEVRLPRDFLGELGRSPNRPLKDFKRAGEAADQRVPTQNPQEHLAPPVTCEEPATEEAPRAAAGAALQSAASPLRAGRRSREETQALWGRASADERARYYAASRDRLTCFEFDRETQLTPEDRGYLLAELAQLALARPVLATKAAQTPPPHAAGPRRLSVLELARARRQVLEAVPAAQGGEILRQVIWAVEEGALRRFASRLALNIALKKIREGAWSKPHRMPPNWHPRAHSPARAAPEQCSAA